jgi:hypothetical protein
MAGKGADGPIRPADRFPKNWKPATITRTAGLGFRAIVGSVPTPTPPYANLRRRTQVWHGVKRSRADPRRPYPPPVSPRRAPLVAPKVSVSREWRAFGARATGGKSENTGSARASSPGVAGLVVTLVWGHCRRASPALQRTGALPVHQRPWDRPASARGFPIRLADPRRNRASAPLQACLPLLSYCDALRGRISSARAQIPCLGVLEWMLKRL